MESLIDVLDEQVAFEFSGRVNILDSSTGQLLGSVIVANGKVWHATYSDISGMKALVSLYIEDQTAGKLRYIVEPEIVEGTLQSIHYPFSVLKKKLNEILDNYQESLSHRPPENIKLELKADFIAEGEVLDQNEFRLMSVIADYNLVSDIYKKCEMMDYEITSSLVSLRKKGALKVLK